MFIVCLNQQNTGYINMFKMCHSFRASDVLVHLAHNGMSLIELSAFHWFCVLVAVLVDTTHWWRFSLFYPPWNNVFVVLTHFATNTYTYTYILTIWSYLVCTLEQGDSIAINTLNFRSWIISIDIQFIIDRSILKIEMRNC